MHIQYSCAHRFWLPLKTPFPHSTTRVLKWCFWNNHRLIEVELLWMAGSEVTTTIRVWSRKLSMMAVKLVVVRVTASRYVLFRRHLCLRRFSDFERSSNRCGSDTYLLVACAMGRQLCSSRIITWQEWRNLSCFRLKQAYPPPPRENITKIIRPEYFCVIFGGGYGKIA